MLWQLTKCQPSMGENYPKVSFYVYHLTLWGRFLLWPIMGDTSVWAFPFYFNGNKKYKKSLPMVALLFRIPINTLIKQ
jgi:hypothetical protein